MPNAQTGEEQVGSLCFEASHAEIKACSPQEAFLMEVTGNSRTRNQEVTN